MYSKGVETVEAASLLTKELLAEFEVNAKFWTTRDIYHSTQWRSIAGSAMRICLIGLATGEFLDTAAN